MKLTPLLFCAANSVKTIKNIDVPACRNCIYYTPSWVYSDFTSDTNKCQKFGEKDIVTGEIIYDLANFCRKDETKCGKDAKYFEVEPQIDYKIMKHRLISNMSMYMLTASCLIAIYNLFR